MNMEQTVCSETSAYKIQTPGILHTYLPMKLEQAECSETSAYKIQTPGTSYLPAYEAGTDRVFRNVGI